MTPTVAAPHAHDHSTVNRIMNHVCLALIPCTAFSLFIFGLPALNLLLTTIGAALLCEALCLKMQKASLARLNDKSALLTGWLLALSLPPWAPWWIGASGAFFALGIGKHLYGGLGQNVFNPAMLARVALLISFPVQMTTWPETNSDLNWNVSEALRITFLSQDIPDGITGATALGHLQTELTVGEQASVIVERDFSLVKAFFGLQTGSLGETSSLFLLLGGGWLLSFRIISWHIPLSMLASTALLAGIFYFIDPDHYANPGFHLFSGGLILGAFFIATDPVTSPSSNSGKIVFGAGCGALDFIIRNWAGYPEGIGFAVLFMNAVTPLIDIYFRPRVYGRRMDGSPKNLR